MPGGFMIECRGARGSPTTVDRTTVTPVARSLVARWPGGGSAWSGPAAVILERGGTTERIPIRNLNGRVLWAIRASAVTLIAVLILKGRGSRKSDD